MSLAAGPSRLGQDTTLVPVPSSTTIPLGTDSISASRISAAVGSLLGASRASSQRNWLGAVARLVSDLRPDIGPQIVAYLNSPVRDDSSPLERMSIGEIGVVYEALLALTDQRDRKSQGQFFTPDDVASFMARQAIRFPSGIWLDPCCGVGNLSWHLANAMPDSADFVADRLVLIDVDSVALRTAQAILTATFAAPNDLEVLPRLVERSYRRDFLSATAVPPHDYAILNPPYAATTRNVRFRCADSRELYAYFLERVVAKSKGFVAITPASYLGAAKYAELRLILGERRGGEVLVFDNVPDTCFRGFKYGSTNTSKTNFVRAAITISAPSDCEWRITPILRWTSRSRRRMWQSARDFLVPLRTGPAGEWAKVMPGTEKVWDALAQSRYSLRDIISKEPTDHVLEVASTPRYYVSASKRRLDRGSKHVLYFRTAEDLDRAYILLNSSLPYWWWRCLDGGITLPIRNLLSLPVPAWLAADPHTVSALERSDFDHIVTKLNAGRQNENVRRPREVIDAIDADLLSRINYNFDRVYSSDMFDKRGFGLVQ